MQQVFMGAIYMALVAGMASFSFTETPLQAASEPEVYTVEKVEEVTDEKGNEEDEKPEPEEEAESEPVVEVEQEEPKPLNIDQLIDHHFGAQAANARAVATCESGRRADAVGDKTLQYWQGGVLYGESYGVFQIRYLPGRPEPSQLLDAEFNIKYAADMQRSQGWRPWTCARKLGIR